MKLNLKKLSKNKEVLIYAQSIMRSNSLSKPFSRKLDDLVKMLEDMETDLELSGECIIELDKGRLESIEERNKMLNILKMEDEM